MEPIPGFPDDREFAFAPAEDTGVLYTLRSTRNPRLRFIVAVPATFFPDYAPALSDADLICLGAGEQEELALLMIVTLTDRLADATASLLTPMVLAPGGAPRHRFYCVMPNCPCVHRCCGPPASVGAAVNGPHILAGAMPC